MDVFWYLARASLGPSRPSIPVLEERSKRFPVYRAGKGGRKKLLSAANRRGLIEAGTFEWKITSESQLSAANRRGLIEAETISSPRSRSLGLSAANRRGLIEAAIPQVEEAGREVRYPRRIAAASLKQHNKLNRPISDSQLSAANRRGLIEAGYRPPSVNASTPVIRGESPRPH